jgi:hypothetical protein
VLNRVTAATANANHLDLGALVKLFDHLDRHKNSPSADAPLPNLKKREKPRGNPVFSLTAFVFLQLYVLSLLSKINTKYFKKGVRKHLNFLDATLLLA